MYNFGAVNSYFFESKYQYSDNQLKSVTQIMPREHKKIASQIFNLIYFFSHNKMFRLLLSGFQQ